MAGNRNGGPCETKNVAGPDQRVGASTTLPRDDCPSRRRIRTAKGSCDRRPQRHRLRRSVHFDFDSSAEAVPLMCRHVRFRLVVNCKKVISLRSARGYVLHPPESSSSLISAEQPVRSPGRTREAASCSSVSVVGRLRAFRQTFAQAAPLGSPARATVAPIEIHSAALPK